MMDPIKEKPTKQQFFGSLIETRSTFHQPAVSSWLLIFSLCLKSLQALLWPFQGMQRYWQPKKSIGARFFQHPELSECQPAIVENI